jgi:hypothetical protein
MAKGASGFHVEPVTVREVRKGAAGNSQCMHISKSTQIRFMCVVNLTLVLAGSNKPAMVVFRFSVFQGMGLCVAAGQTAMRR